MDVQDEGLSRRKDAIYTLFLDLVGTLRNLLRQLVLGCLKKKITRTQAHQQMQQHQGADVVVLTVAKIVSPSREW